MLVKLCIATLDSSGKSRRKNLARESNKREDEIFTSLQGFLRSRTRGQETLEPRARCLSRRKGCDNIYIRRRPRRMHVHIYIPIDIDGLRVPRAAIAPPGFFFAIMALVPHARNINDCRARAHVTRGEFFRIPQLTDSLGIQGVLPARELCIVRLHRRAWLRKIQINRFRSGLRFVNAFLFPEYCFKNVSCRDSVRGKE